jgi:hypothetical protein
MDPELTNLIEILITLAAAFIAYVQHWRAFLFFCLFLEIDKI